MIKEGAFCPCCDQPVYVIITKDGVRIEKVNRRD